MVMNKNVVKEGKYIAMLAAKSSQEHHSDKVFFIYRTVCVFMLLLVC